MGWRVCVFESAFFSFNLFPIEFDDFFGERRAEQQKENPIQRNVTENETMKINTGSWHIY